MRPLLALAAALALASACVYFGPDLAISLFVTDDTSDVMFETAVMLVLFGAMLVVGVGGGAIFRVNALALGRQPVVMAAAGGLAGLIGLGAACLYAWLAGAFVPSAESLELTGFLVLGTALILFQAASEEVFFRGWLQPVLARSWGSVAAVAVTTAAFAAIHIIGQPRSPVTLLNLFLGGLLFGILALHARGIAASIAAHFTWNWSETMLLGLVPNPGVGSFGAIRDFDLAGSALWGGSEEGLNASLAMSFALIVLLVPLVMVVSKTAIADPPEPNRSDLARS